MVKHTTSMIFSGLYSRIRVSAFRNAAKSRYSTDSSSAERNYGKVLSGVKHGVFTRVKAIGKKYRNFIIFSGMLQVVAVLADDNKDLHKRYKLKMEKYDEIMTESMKYGPTYWETLDIEKEFKPIDNLFKEKDQRRNIFSSFYKVKDFILNAKNKNKYIEEYKQREIEKQEHGELLTDKQKALFEEENAKLWKELVSQANSDVSGGPLGAEPNESMSLTKSELAKGEKLPAEIKALMEKEKKLATYYYDAPIVRVDNGEAGSFASAPESGDSGVKRFI